MMNMQIREQVRREMNTRMPYKETEYRNGIVAHAIANGHAEKLTDEWVRKTFLSDVEDGFITYEQALNIFEDYCKAVQAVKRMF